MKELCNIYGEPVYTIEDGSPRGHVCDLCGQLYCDSCGHSGVCCVCLGENEE